MQGSSSDSTTHAIGTDSSVSFSVQRDTQFMVEVEKTTISSANIIEFLSGVVLVLLTTYLAHKFELVRDAKRKEDEKRSHKISIICEVDAILSRTGPMQQFIAKDRARLAQMEKENFPLEYKQINHLYMLLYQLPNPDSRFLVAVGEILRKIHLINSLKANQGDFRALLIAMNENIRTLLKQ
jgi:hypothetical protein